MGRLVAHVCPVSFGGEYPCESRLSSARAGPEGCGRRCAARNLSVLLIPYSANKSLAGNELYDRS
jgi:hypothetical protein